jgi:hypothetical protein
MSPRQPLNPDDLRGATRLATDATAGITNLVEAMHERIARLPGVPAPARAGRTRGITGLVYRSVRGVTQVTGRSLDALLGLLPKSAAPARRAARREALLAVLNGVVGDHLEATANPLAIRMTLRHAGQALDLQPAALAQALPGAGPDLLLMIHGLCMNDLQWSRAGANHGTALAQALGFTPLHLHYNSGRAIALNGWELAGLLQQLLQAWPVAPRRLVLLGHSMGGLVARSALHQARQAGLSWAMLADAPPGGRRPAPARSGSGTPEAARQFQEIDLVCLGAPHHGAPLERAGSWIDLLLGAAPYAAPLARLGRVRSAGITDLRHGRLLPVKDDVPGRAGRGHRPAHVPLPQGVRCFALAARLGAGPKPLKARLLGDGLVPVASALGEHRDPARGLHFLPQRQCVIEGLNHLQLLSDARVGQQLQRWLEPQGAESPAEPAPVQRLRADA